MALAEFLERTSNGGGRDIIDDNGPLEKVESSSSANVDGKFNNNISLVLSDMHGNSSNVEVNDKAPMVNFVDSSITSNPCSLIPSLHGDDAKCSSDVQVDYTLSTPCTNSFNDTMFDKYKFDKKRRLGKGLLMLIVQVLK